LYLPESITGFYVRYSENGKRPFKNIGTDPVDILARFQAIERNHSRVLEGMLPLDEPIMATENSGDRTLSSCAEQCEKEKTSGGRSPYSIAAYTGSKDYFIASCGDKSKEAQVVIEKWRVEYVTERPHSALGYRPPAPGAYSPWVRPNQVSQPMAVT
jgi:hypothetical protein